MFEFSHIGKTLVIIGLIIAAVGVFFLAAGKIPGFGRLPGAIFIKGKNFSFYFPLTTSILISIVLTIIIWFFRHK